MVGVCTLTNRIVKNTRCCRGVTKAGDMCGMRDFEYIMENAGLGEESNNRGMERG